MEFLVKMEDHVKLTRADKKKISKDDLTRMSLLLGSKAGTWPICWQRSTTLKAHCS